MNVQSLKQLLGTESVYPSLIVTLLSSSNDGVALIDTDQNLVLVNNLFCSYFGRTVEEASDGNLKEWLSSFQENATQKWLELVALAKYNNQLKAIDFLLKTREGKLHLSVKGEYIQNDNDKGASYLLTIWRNITSRVQFEEEKKKLEANIKENLKSISHDFNNVLMTIIGNAELALMDIPATSPVCKRIIAIEEASRRAAKLCDQMFSYSSEGKFIFDKIDLSDAVKGAEHIINSVFKDNIELEYCFAEDLPDVLGEMSQIRLIIMNLISNAIEAIGERPGVIKINSGVMDCKRAYLNESHLDLKLRAGSYAFIEVADNGCGIDENSKAKLFDPFFTTKTGHRGLGLSAILSVMNRHNGAVKVESKPGCLTSFKILFPAKRKLESKVSIDSKPIPRLWRGKGAILLVDDEEGICTVGRYMLEKMGFSVLTASDGVEAVKTFKKKRKSIKCIILDMTMPRMSGDKALTKIMEIDPDVPVIMSSGYHRNDIKERLNKLNISGFLKKPYDFFGLNKVLKLALTEQNIRFKEL